MRHRQDTTDNRPLDYLVSTSGQAAPTRSRVRQPPAEAAMPQSEKLVQDVVALAHTLVAPLPFERATEEALLHGASLLQGARELRLYAANASEGARLRWLAAVSRAAGRASAAPSTPAAGMEETNTLGHGPAVDRQVLDERRAARLPAAQCIPLIGSHGTLLGVLEIEPGTSAARQPEAPLTGLLADHLAALLERRSEQQARDAFVSLAAHELRSPLTSIKGYAQLLMRQARKTPLPETMQRSVETIEQQSLRMAEMVGEMLDASRILRGKLEVTPGPTDLVPLTQKVVERRRAYFPQHEIAFETAESALVGNWDAQRVEQILRDLIDNAGHHTPGSGVVTVSVSRERGSALMRIRDAGIGVADEDRERIFDYLYRSPRSEERNLSGLGLGLFVCRYLAERMGGRLWLHETSTAAPSCSEFRVTLPLA